MTSRNDSAMDRTPAGSKHIETGADAHRRRSPRPLNMVQLNDLALRYVGRFATTRAKLAAYLKRKLSECGWDDQQEPDISGIIERVADLGYVDDAAYAEAKARSLSRRGYGARRVGEAIRAAGVKETHSEGALREAEEARVSAALAFARRRRWGPYAREEVPDDDRMAEEKRIAAFLRAGHDARLARAILKIAPGGDISALE